MRRLAIPVLILLIAAATLWQRDAGTGLPGPAQGAGQPAETRAGLPAEAWATLELIERGGPFPYRKDGSVFQNREGHLPAAERGHYREYTVPTPGAPDRGPRRLVTGGTPPTTWYYTDDHYRSFRSISLKDRHSP
ncbi:MAG: ribonuclease [Chromatiales bacterium]|jgi:guanyl-specific ribonuclease Sa|nr:MAG: ribonuclease [Chromatiales bacterium]